MPEYLAPGVFVEEVSFRGKSIAGVGTSVAGMVGPMRTGPLRGKPEPVTSYEEFKRTFGDEEALEFGRGNVLNHCAIAAKAFFDNGGKQLYPVRTISGVNAVDASGDGSDAERAVTADDGDVLTFEAGGESAPSGPFARRKRRIPLGRETGQKIRELFDERAGARPQPPT